MEKVENISSGKTGSVVHLHGAPFCTAAEHDRKTGEDIGSAVRTCITDNDLDSLRAFSYRQKSLKGAGNDGLLVTGRYNDAYSWTGHNLLFFRSSNVSISGSTASSSYGMESCRSMLVVSLKTSEVLHRRSRKSSGISLFSPIR